MLTGPICQWSSQPAVGHLPNKTTVTAVADRPARCRGSAHAKYSVSHHMVIKQFFLLGLAA